MTVDETVLFYVKLGNEAQKRILDRVEAGETFDLEDGDVLHNRFCFGCVDYLTRLQLRGALNSANIQNRLWPNWHLYQRSLFDQKYREWS